MHSALTLSSLALALSAVRATPLPSSQSTSLTLADTVNFIAKTVGTNPNPGALPDVNNYVAVAVHSGATTNLYTLVDPSTLTLNNSDPSIFRNGSALGPDDVGYHMYLTIGNVETFSNWPFSMFFSMTHQNSSSNPGAQAGFVDLNVGVGTPGYDVVDGILAVTYAEDFFWACPDVVVEGGTAIAIGHVRFLSCFEAWYVPWITDACFFQLDEQICECPAWMLVD